ncbi:hypothetical protein SY27_11315 [Flavobacterium sp. 316]|uniref:hypothetical protein n=1 Tax=Flavobacterium sp. 316 TaxID=1603293 RepID=UPI0005E64D96|nr:hypothetical protein [Flavobacterium sp. 316]KIX20499.1 hypothetical protein SY27_11315 [Flavobacterium sp. 316]
MKLFSKRTTVFDILILTLLVLIYSYLTLNTNSDIPAHAQFIKDYTYGIKAFPVNFLYYLVVYILSFFSNKTSALLLVSIYVLSFISFFKYNLIKQIFIKECEKHYKKAFIISSVFAALLIFAFSLPSILVLKGYYYLLSFPPNVWHNSTTIFVTPFAFLLFWLSYKQLDEYKKSRIYFITLLIIINVFIKPSFLFTYLLVYPFFLLYKYKFTKLFWVNIMPLIISSILIVIEFYFIFINSDPSVEKSSVTIDFFHFLNVWAKPEGWFDYILIIFSTIISSFLFPIVFLLKNKKELKTTMIKFALSCLVVGIIISNVFTETGPRESDGNFLWQNYICSFILFFSCTFYLLKSITTSPEGIKPFRIEVFFLLLHFIAFIFYFLIIKQTLSYY